eukprot:Protomagalhaensia_wolfi_Nauph_80__2144@NODE_237_length_3080_cov_47_558040_g177_i0_p2_GENE_NODE_237_length_3080_cov_47_558040_g177_i0NODE_237_length_3080_cov_47_558040_g177_i0_p2_ORF_typecomplete_len296_score9_49HlyIII/PF03006_20/2_1e26DUF2964/PF11177_8/2_8e03DUF2964/PF11177_8/1_8DUF2964/PF11177_8/22DUF2964/PF11177_8/1e04DUF2070/PF09843_9/1_2YfhO/PF09586_10/9_4_NODE_237_length_3080_cov_47_558040_g177_i045932
MITTPSRSACSSESRRRNTNVPSPAAAVVGIRVKSSSPLHQNRRKSSCCRLKVAQYRDQTTPLLRGKIHLALVYACPIWIYGLFEQCQSQRALVAAFVSALSAFINFGSSALLHNVKWESARTRRFWRRVDHLGIFLMIAGSCSPVPGLLFSRPMFIRWLLFDVSALLFGLVACVFTDAFSVSGSYALRASCYVVVGLSNLLFLSEFHRVLTPDESLLFYGMAAIYVVGAAAYALKWPNPWEKVIGYHEVFHLFCLAAAILTFCVNLSVIKRTSRPHNTHFLLAEPSKHVYFKFD